MYAFFVDLKAAFDSIDRNALFYKLYQLGISTKIIKLFQSLYKNTTARVCDGDLLSESFITSTGVRQGCGASPTLFAFFINDLPDELEVGIEIDGIELKLLMYADDIVILSDEPRKLQRMINCLVNYCQKWNLTVNLLKSKIMIFHKGGGTRRLTEKWYYGNEEIEIVNRYTYLGMTLTPRLSMTAHLTERLGSAKRGLVSTWGNFLNKETVPHSAKFKLFYAVARAVLCYGAQVWGFLEYEEGEKLQRFFIKKLFRLPHQTPSYMLTLETGVSAIYIYTLRCHFLYLVKVLFNYHDSRLPKILAQLVIQDEIYWFSIWKDLAEKHNLEIDMSGERNSFINRLLEIVEREEEWQLIKAKERAHQSVRHEIYNKLNYDSGALGYVRDCNSTAKINTIFRYRGGLLNLNASPWRTHGSRLCSMCNLEEEEDLSHYLGRCPILAEMRIDAFGKKILSDVDIVNVLNGPDFGSLIKFANKAWKYRKFLIEEFN